MKKQISYLLLAITLVLSITYLIINFINSSGEVNQISKIISSSLLALFAIFFVVCCLTLIKTKEARFINITSVLLSLFIGFNLGVSTHLFNLPVQETVKNYTNISIAEAMKWAAENKIEIEQKYETSDTIPNYYIISQSITAGTLTKKIEKIEFTVSIGPNYDKTIIVPSMIGWSTEAVLDYINTNYLNNVKVEFTESSENKNLVISQSKSGEMRRNDELTLTFSIGSLADLTPVELMDFTNRTLFDSTFWLKMNGFKYNLTYEFSDTILKNRIISQAETIGKIYDPKTDTINLVVSKGKKIIVPNLLSMKVEDITKWVIDNKLTIKFSDRYDENVELGKVIDANLKEGDEIEEGTLVSLTTSKGQLKMEKFSNITDFRNWATKYNILYNEEYEFNDNIASGNIISFSVNENEVIKNNQTITVKISQGSPISIPNFIGKTKSNISSTCNNLGLNCKFVNSGYTSATKDTATAQNKRAGSTVVKGTDITITISIGPAKNYNLYIQATWLVIGNADASVASLKQILNNECPGVTFNITKKAINSGGTYGMIHPDSPIQGGRNYTFTQGQTYQIWIIG